METQPHEFDSIRDVNPHQGPLGHVNGDPHADFGGDDAAHRDLAGLSKEMSREFREKEALCLEHLEWLAERNQLAIGEAVRVLAVPELMARSVEIAQFLKNNPGSIGIFVVLHVIDLPIFDDINQHECISDFAKRIMVEKATVNNLVLELQKKLGLPPRKDQRNEEQRAKMTESRLAQLSDGGGK
jgi:hypothetical protein